MLMEPKNSAVGSRESGLNVVVTCPVFEYIEGQVL